jgi:hypothetical protein
MFEDVECEPGSLRCARNDESFDEFEARWCQADRRAGLGQCDEERCNSMAGPPFSAYCT